MKTITKKLGITTGHGLFRMQDRNERILLSALYVWFNFTLKQIRRSLTEKFAKDITSELTDWEFIEEQGQEILRPAALKIMQSSGDKAYKLFQVQGAFDVLNPSAVEAADKVVGHLVRDVTQNTKEGIRSYIKTGIKEGKAMDKIARELRPIVGLTERQVESVANYRRLLEDKEFPSKQINSKVASYTNKTHRRRMQTIARTETARAQNVGYAVGLEDLGVEQLEFAVHPDEKTCEVCYSLDKKRYKVGEASAVIPVHPNCRCAMLPVVADREVCEFSKSIRKAGRGCIPIDDLPKEQIDDLLKRLEASKDPAEGRKLRRSLRKLGHKGGLKPGQPSVSVTPRVKPTKPVVPKIKPKPTKGVKAQRQWENSLTAKDKEEIWYWGKGSHAEVHAAELKMSRFIPPGRSMKDARIYQKKFYKILEDAPPTKLKVFRGSAFNEFEFARKDYVAGKIVKFKTTTSSTSSETIAKKFMRSHPKKDLMNREVRYLFEIDAKTAVDFRGISTFKIEKELILRRGTQYSVEKVIQEKGYTRVLLKEVVGKPKPPMLVARPKMKPHKLNEPNWGQQKKWEASLSREEKKAISGWGRGMDEFWELRYSLVNKKLPLEADVIDELSPEALKKLISAFRSMISKSPLYKGETWRAMGFSSKKALKKKFVRGKKVTFKFTSSSTRTKDVAGGFMEWAQMEGELPVLLKVQSKTGTYLGKLSYQNQEEVLLHAGSKYKVKSIKLMKDVSEFAEFEGTYHQVVIVEI